MPHGWAKPISAISAISAGLKKSKKYSGTEKIKKFSGTEKSLVRTNTICFMFHVSCFIKVVPIG